MPGTPHPFAGPYGNRSSSELLAATKLNLCLVVADVAEVRNADLSGQFGGIYVRSVRLRYRIDTEDTQADDGLNVIIDDAGTHFLKTVDSITPTVATYDDSDVTGGALTVADDVDVALINTSTSVNVNLPAAADRNGSELFIKDIGGTGFTPVCDGSETIDDGAADAYEVTTAKGWLGLVPVSGGYIVKSSQL